MAVDEEDGDDLVQEPEERRTFYLEFDARTDLFTPPQQVAHQLGDRADWRVRGRQPSDRKLMTFPMTAAQLGTGDMAELVIDVDRTFSPGGGDIRELGIRVFHAFVEPR